MDWYDYLGGRLLPFKAETALFPLADELTLDPATKFQMRQDRYRWLRSLLPKQSEWLYDVWMNAADRLLDEKESPDNSNVLGPYLLRAEVDNIPYYQRLRALLRIRTVRNRPVLIVGPTAGGEVQAVHAAGAEAHLLADPAPWRWVCDERLHDDRIPFDNAPAGSLTGNCVNSRYVVLSAWLPDPERWVQRAYDALGRWGFILFPRSSHRLAHEADRLGLEELDGFQDEVAVYFKSPALLQMIGD